MLRKILKFLLFVAFVTILYLSTYGWHFKKVSISAYSTEQEEIARNLKKYVTVLSDTIGWRGIDQYDNLHRSAGYISSVFKNLGYEVDFQELSVRGKKVYNIISQKKGSRDPDRIIIVGAHYDSYFNPGANSNASGVAALIESARLWVHKQPGATIRFIAFVNTEDPFFATENMGSFAYVQRARELQENITAVIILDSLGTYSTSPRSQRYPLLWGIFYPNKANFILLVGNIASRDLMRWVKQTFSENVSLPMQSTLGYDFINSDHWAFWKMNYKAVLITDTGPYRNAAYHSLGDTYDTLNYTNIAYIVYGMRYVLEELAK